jgi:cell division protein FtsA
MLVSMIEPRMEEIFVLANREVKKNHFAELLGGGVVLTGGSSLMPGVTELAERVLEMPVRLGVPQGVGGLTANVQDPRFSTGVGLVMHAMHQETGEGRNDNNHRERARPSRRNLKDMFTNLLYR